MNEKDILIGLLGKARSCLESKNFNGALFSQDICLNADIMIDKINSNKSILGALVTSCLKKIINPAQDIRLHRVDFDSGYSARSLDTKVTVPFFKEFFPKYANKESAFLTLATRERIKWTKKDGDLLRIRDKNVKKAFLFLIEGIQSGDIPPEDCLVYIFYRLLQISQQMDMIYNDTIITSKYSGVININKVIQMLEAHFETKLSSRLPVIAIYSVYETLLSAVKRYYNKRLGSLNVHTSSDKHGFGDVEIWNDNDSPFEMVEIKHNIPIDRNMIFDIVKKSRETTIQRYYLLTTYENCFESKAEEEYVNQFILMIKKDYGLEIIANGILQSLKYYLRFIDDYSEFVELYTRNLIKDSRISTEINESHIRSWSIIMENNQVEN